MQTKYMEQNIYWIRFWEALIAACHDSMSGVLKSLHIMAAVSIKYPNCNTCSGANLISYRHQGHVVDWRIMYNVYD